MSDIEESSGGQEKDLKSELNFYSMAKSAHNKPIGEKVCEVILLEMSTFLDGELTDRGVVEDYEYTDGQGNKKAGKETSSASVPATWWGFESNRITPPDVRRDEELIIFKYGDSNRLFWTPRNTNRHKRKLETVTWGYSGTIDEGDNTVTEDNHYIAEVSTHKKHIVLTTSDANGEVVRYFINILPGEGKFIVADSNNNEVLIDSTQNLIRLLNGDDAYMELLGQHATLSLPGDYTVDVKGNAIIKVGGNADIDVAGNATFKAANYDMTAAKITLNGEVAVNGAFSVSGTTQLAGLAAGLAEFSGFVKLPGGYGPK